MRPHVLTKMMFDCRCGQSHPQVTRLAGVPVLVCPEARDDAIRLHIGPTGNVVIVMGDSEALDSAVGRVLEALNGIEGVEAAIRERFDKIASGLAAAVLRLDALEAKLKRGAKE